MPCQPGGPGGVSGGVVLEDMAVGDCWIGDPENKIRREKDGVVLSR